MTCAQCGTPLTPRQRGKRGKFCSPACAHMPRPVIDRLMAKVAFHESGCWLWQGATRKGYGQIQTADGTRYAHRIAYELLVGPIPEGLTLDHLCRNPGCVNPSHLEPVTMGVNVLRGTGVSARNAAKTHCPQGHEYTPENIYTRSNRRGRECRACVIARSHAYYHANKAAA